VKIKHRNNIALLLLLSLAITILPLSIIGSANADLTWHAYLTAAPNPVGVGQQVLVVFGFTMPTANYENSYLDWTLMITDPDNNTQKVTDLNTEVTGSTFYTFKPDKVGIWTIQAHYPGGYVILGPYSMTGTVNQSVPAADTNAFQVTVQEQQLTEFPMTPLPTNYWEFPIYGENQAWYQIAGNWLMSDYDSERYYDCTPGAVNPYTTVPNTGHILWTKQQLLGGIVGGSNAMTYFTGSSYRFELSPPVIMNGKLYYNVREPPSYGFYCVDLATGKTLWFNNGTFPDGNGGLIEGRAAMITFGQVLTLDNPNWHGGIPLLWSVGDLTFFDAISTWAVRNAFDGNLLYTIENAMTPTLYLDYVHPLGSFTLDNQTGTVMANIFDYFNDRLIVWNSTLMFANTIGLGGFYSNGLAPTTYDLDWNAGVQLNVTIPHIDVSFGNYFATQTDPKDASIMVINNQVAGEPLAGQPFNDVAFSLKDGHMLWNKTRNEGTWESIDGGRSALSISDDCYAIYRKETRQVYVYSVKTGDEKWVSEPRASEWGMFVQGITFAYGKCYVIAYDGMIYTYDANTGKELWTWGPVNSGLTTPYGVYPLFCGMVVADHKLIVSNGEHTANSPLYPGERMYVVDADNGTTIWSMDGWYQGISAANGIVLAPNGYDGNIYCFGKGPSATTVNTPSVGVTTATPITISGTVMDVSAGTSQSAVAKNFPNGLPCVSDESQSQWMSYIYQQQTLPTNTTGVPVTISVIDANSNYREIGQTISLDGTFSYTWTPDISGDYQVIASFAGSNSYYPSSAVGHFYASDGATPAPTTMATQPVDNTMVIVGSTVAIIVAVAIVGVILVSMVRKRP
jgi:outer membrane protein assembly factor BamB